MSYQVLARKWRPRSFAEMVGQEHVLRALINALDNDRLHHAFLFTGTRGVGKTTIARILAKSLNCEQGVSSTPCGQCSACTEIDAGRFVDLIEIDAASRTGVDDVRELTDNVVYTPARGRYKVYLIDEVHMFSKSAFNALLKTLEEPPPHVKFLFATTEPQKLPVTILSRCLQFNLKRLPQTLIAQHLARILEQEQIAHESAALQLLARAADGSMRDALSLLDQAIAFGGGGVRVDEVRSMLGSIEQEHVHALLDALADGDAAALLACIAELTQRAPDFTGMLEELVTTLQRIAVAQAVPDAVDDSYGDRERILHHAQRLAAEDVQLFYQIGLIGRRDLPLAPEPRGGFEMVLLRMLAFRPGQAAVPVQSSAPPRRVPAAPSGGTVTAKEQAKPATSAAPAPQPATRPAPAASRAGNEWDNIVANLNLRGIPQQLAANCHLQSRDGDTLHLTLDTAHAQLHTPQQEQRLQQALQDYFKAPVKLVLKIGAPENETPAQRQQRETAERQQAAQQALEQDPGVRALQETFNARIQPDTVRPVD